MKIYDISLTITPTLPVWPGDPPVVLERVAKIEAGANANVSRLDMGAHTGTHVDAPYHFLGDSPVTIDKLNLDILTGGAFVLQLPESVDLVTANVLETYNLPPGINRLLLKTRNSQYWAQKEEAFQTNFVGLDTTAAQFLVTHGFSLIGVDYLSVAPYKKSRPTHEILLRAGLVILEGLDLSAVPQGQYDLYCLPLKLGGADGAPARAILIG